MMSKWVNAESSEESDEEDNSGPEQIAGNTKGPQKLRFGKFALVSSDEEEEKRVVKSKKDKKEQGFKRILNDIRNHVRNNDIALLLTDFENLNKEKIKSKNILYESEDQLPEIYIKIFIILDTHISEITTEIRKKFAGPKNKAYNTLKNKLKKLGREIQDQITEYNQKPLVSEEEEAEDDDEEEEEVDNTEEDDEDDDEEEDDDEDEEEEVKKEDSSSDDEELSQAIEKRGRTPAERRLYWVKKGPDTSSDEEEYSGSGNDMPDESDEDDEDDDRSRTTKKSTGEKKRKPPKPQQVIEYKETIIKEGGELDFEMTKDNISKFFMELTERRGRAGYLASNNVKLLTKLGEATTDFYLAMRIQIALISTRQELSKNTIDNHLTVEQWRQSYQDVLQLLDLLESKPSFRLKETLEEGEAMAVAKEEEEGEDPKLIHGSLATYLERLESELTLGFQSAHPKSKTYLYRLKDEFKLLFIAERVSNYYKKAEMREAQARATLTFLQHIYYKHDSLLEKLCSRANELERKYLYIGESTEKVIFEHCCFIYQYGKEKMKETTKLCHIFHHSIHNRYQKARDLLLMSKVHNAISYLDQSTQVLYNRVLVELALSAFRNGLIAEAQVGLSEINSFFKLKEFLGQGLITKMEKNVQQEWAERKRQMPFHMQIDLQLVIAVSMLSAMLLEVPNLTFHYFNMEKDVISKQFRLIMNQHFENMWQIPQETDTREIVANAATALHDANWALTYDIIARMKIWNNVWDKENILTMLKQKIKEAAIATYIYSSRKFYKSYSLLNLAEMFQLEIGKVKAILCKLLFNHKINGSMNRETQTLKIIEDQPTTVQFLALQLLEKGKSMVENNEKLLEGIMQQGKGINFESGLPRNLLPMSNIKGYNKRPPGGAGGYQGKSSNKKYK